jgi:uncharacterized protein
LLAINPANTSKLPIARTSYPDMSNVDINIIFRGGSVSAIFKLNIPNFIWNQLSFITSGGYFKFLGIFLLGYHLASIDFFKKTPKYTTLIARIIIPLMKITIASKLTGGSTYEVPTIKNIGYKFLSMVGQLTKSIS